MRNRKTLGIGTAFALAIGIALVGPAGPAAAVTQLGSQYCSYGYNAYTRGGAPSGGWALTIIHQQTNAGVTRMSGLYTQPGQTRSWSAGWQSFSASSISSYAVNKSKGCS